MNDIRSLFPVALDRVYMDHASEGPMPAPARKAVEKLLRLYVREGKPSVSDYTEVIEEARKLAAGLLNASPSEIAFVKNTSHGIILAIASIPWRPGSRGSWHWPPIFLHLLKDNLNLVFLLYLCGFAGVLLSPTHLCLIVTRDYFKADLLRVYRRLLPLVAAALVIGFLISYLRGIDVGAIPSMFR